MNFINSSKAVVLSLCAFSFLHSNAQNNKEEKSEISTKPFTDGTNHWYHIKDAFNIVNPVPNQPQYAETDYAKIADNILLFQRNNGGWPKNYDMKAILTPKQIDTVIKTKPILHTTFDNETTYTHVNYLAQVYTLTKDAKYKDGALKGIDFILEAQYGNGGWPQYFPLEKGYSRHITFNDGAYMGIMNLLKKIVNNDPDFAFIDPKIRKKVTASYEKGITCILKMQIKDDGKLTAWCQQHDEITLLPAWARKFEPPSICNAESVDVVLFLMAFDNPNEKIINSVQSAVKWFQDSKIYNTRVESFKAPEMESKYKKITNDVRIVTDSTAPPIWTRYYELGTHKPLFCDRDSQFLYSLAEVSRERRSGYAWYTDKPEKVLKKYAAWQKKWDSGNDVLKN
ncbi:pectate lyase [Flavobacterium panici]|uniref:Pectate lyase n=1 Tax=Flavobacterium panici TaxID=2654843 RepID=A0A9N8IYU1_9FLAO|nr:pectate lyase [Flavobacterium panici]CAC9973043.1 pectate lyase [Flavobacterium panici]